MKGKCACLADFFLLQKKEGDYSRLIRENKIIGIACRVAASSNKTLNLTPKTLAAFTEVVGAAD
jgi:hypothetical protein